MPFVYAGIGQAPSEVDAVAQALALATSTINRATVLGTAVAAISANTADRAQDATIQTQAQAIIDNPATTLTQAQVIGALKQLAQGISVLAAHDDLAKRELTGLARLVCDALDTTDGTA